MAPHEDWPTLCQCFGAKKTSARLAPRKSWMWGGERRVPHREMRSSVVSMADTPTGGRVGDEAYDEEGIAGEDGGRHWSMAFDVLARPRQSEPTRAQALGSIAFGAMPFAGVVARDALSVRCETHGTPPRPDSPKGPHLDTRRANRPRRLRAVESRRRKTRHHVQNKVAVAPQGSWQQVLRICPTKLGSARATCLYPLQIGAPSQCNWSSASGPPPLLRQVRPRCSCRLRGVLAGHTQRVVVGAR